LLVAAPRVIAGCQQDKRELLLLRVENGTVSQEILRMNRDAGPGQVQRT
jgi:hypothetical protein